MRRSTLVKVGILLVGVILVAYSAVIGSSETRVITIIGVILIILGVMTFFFGEGEEKEIEPEET